MPSTRRCPAPDSARWGSFTPDELEIIQYALVATADFLAEDAAGGEFDRTSLEGVAVEYLATITLAHQIDDHLGKEHPPINEALRRPLALETANRIRGGAAAAARTQPDHAA